MPSHSKMSTCDNNNEKSLLLHYQLVLFLYLFQTILSLVYVQMHCLKKCFILFSEDFHMVPLVVLWLCRSCWKNWLHLLSCCTLWIKPNSQETSCSYTSFSFGASLLQMSFVWNRIIGRRTHTSCSLVILQNVWSARQFWIFHTKKTHLKVLI